MAIIFAAVDDEDEEVVESGGGGSDVISLLKKKHAGKEGRRTQSMDIRKVQVSRSRGSAESIFM